MMSKPRHSRGLIRRHALAQFVAALLAALLTTMTCPVADAEIVFTPPDGRTGGVTLKRGPVALSLKPSWSACSVTTRGGKGIGLIDPILYGINPKGIPGLYWCDRGWARLKWVPVEQTAERDLLYVEGDYEGWRVQVWMAMHGDEETAYVRKRITHLRGTGTLTSTRGVMAIYHGKDGVQASGITVEIDGEKDPFPTRPIKQYLLFRKKDVSAAIVNPGEALQKRGNRYGTFGSFIHHPKSRFLEASFTLGQSDMKAGDFVENAFVLLWGDGDISERVGAALADTEKLAARIPPAVRPLGIDKPPTTVAAWPTGLPRAILKSSFHTLKGRTQRVWPAGARLERPPIIDGKLDDDAWKGKWAGQFILHDTGNVPTDVNTEHQVRYDARALYLAVKCAQPHLDKIRQARHKPNRYSSGEQIEVFFMTGNDVYQLCIDPAGGFYDSKNGDVNAPMKWTVKTQTDAAGWTLEAEIPLAALGMQTPQPFDWTRFNIARIAGRLDMRSRISSWNPAMGQLAGSNNHGRLFFGTEEEYGAEQRFSAHALLDRGAYSTLHAAAGAYVDIRTTGGIPDGTKLLAGIADKAGKWRRASECDVTGNRAGLAIDIKGLPTGDYEARFALRVAGQLTPYTRTDFRITRPVREAKGRGSIPVTVRSARSSARLPVATAVAFPIGELTDPLDVRLLDGNGRQIPAHTSPLATWDPAGSISWLRLNFQTPVEADIPRNFTLEYGGRAARTLAAPVSVNETAQRFTVNTGPLQFTVPRAHGGVLESVFLDANGDGKFEKAEQIITGPDRVGPYLVDADGKLYEASRDKQAKVVTEERNSQRVVFRIEGAYRAEDGAELCKHVTRLTAYAGLPHLRIEHTWIMTAATGEAAFKDIAFALPTTQGRRVVFGTEDGIFTDFSAYPRYLLQDTHLHYEIHGPYKRTLAPDAKERNKLRRRAFVEGGKAPGWIAAKGERAGMVLAADEFWQNFPKEIGLEDGRVTFHIWPKHGRPRNRPVTDATITKLDFVHSGGALDFAFPEEAANHKTANKYEQGFIKGAARANAIGLAKTHRFALTFFPASTLIPDAAEEARALADTPSAMAGPEWMARSGVFGPLHPYDPDTFPEVEEAFASAARIVPRLNHLDGHYGMWIYGQLHTDYNYPSHRWDIYRLFNQLHHNGPRWPWIMWFRSGDADYFDFALANARILADVGFCHYSRPEFEKLPYPGGKARGALTDYKGLVPWHSGNRNPDYNSLTAFLMWHYYMTGDARTREVALMWGDLAKLRGPAGGSRTGSGTVRAAMDLYIATWDAALIPVFRRTALALIGSQAGSGAYLAWENYTPWLADYARFTGEASARDSLIKWADAYAEGYGDLSSDGSGWGMYMNVPAGAYFASGDPRHAGQARALLELWTWGIHSDPESHLIGNYPGRYAREMSFFGNLLVRGPVALEAWARAGKSVPPLYPRRLMQARKQKDGAHRLEILILKEKDGDVLLDLGGKVVGKDVKREFPMRIRVTAPDGAAALDEEIKAAPRAFLTHGSTRAYPRDWTRLMLARDGKRGVYRLVVLSKDAPFSLRLPVSDHREAYRLPSQGRIRLHENRNNMAAFYLPKGVARPTLSFTLQHKVPATVHIRDPEFKIVKKVHLMGLYPQSNRRAVSLDLPKDYPGGFWTVISGISPQIDVTFTGDWRPKYFSTSPDRAFSPEQQGL